MKKLVRNLVILSGVVASAVLVKKVYDTKKVTENEEEKDENTCFCSWKKIEESTGFDSKNKKLKMTYQQ